MSEGQSLEKQHEAVPNPETEILSVLEKGEIENMERLMGSPDVSVADIKDDGRALFKVSTDEFVQVRKKIFARADLELLAAELDRILGFNLVPPVVAREIRGKKGVLQQLVSARPIEMPDEYQLPDLAGWSDILDIEEISKAAVFDFIIGAKDRHGGNFLIDVLHKKVWLIDHDYLMFFQELGYGSDLIRAALNKDAAHINDQVRDSLKKLLDAVDSLSAKFPGEATKTVLLGVKDRTEELLRTNQIPNLV